MPEALRTCPSCGNTRLKNVGDGRETTVWEFEPARFVRHVHVQEVLKCRCADYVVTAPGAPKVIEKGRYGASVLAHLVIAKCGNHIPIYRLEKDYRLADSSIDARWIVMIDTESNTPIGIVTTWTAFRPLDKMMFWWLLGSIKLPRPAEDAFNESVQCQGCKVPVGKLSCWVKLNGALDDGSFRCMPAEWKTFAMKDLR